MNRYRTRIKICGLTRVDDALAAAGAGADAIGLVFWPGTPRVVDVGRARAIADALPPFVTKVALFVDPEADEVRAIVDAVPVDVLQFHGSEAFCAGELPGGTGRSFDWTRLTPELRAALPAPLILSGGLDAANVGDAIRAVRPWAVDVSSGVEALDSAGRPRKGIKDAARIAAFVQGVRDADG